MELTDSENKILEFVKSTRFWVILCAVGIWSQFIFTIVNSKHGVQSVYIDGGEVDAKINGSVKVKGSVDVDNTVDINVAAINGYSNCFYNSYSKHPKKYYRIPVVDID